MSGLRRRPQSIQPAAGSRQSFELGGEETFRQLVNGIRDYAIYSLDAGGHVRTWNAGAERIKGYRAEEVLGQHFSLFYTPEDLAAGKADQELAIAVAEGRYEEDGWRVRKDGTRFWANVVLTTIYDENHNLVGFGKVTRDTSEQHEQAEQLAQSTLELTEANIALRGQAAELAEARDVATTAVHRQEFGRRLANALDMAEGEPEVFDVIERSFASVLPTTSVELLLADNSHAHLRRLAHHAPAGEPPGCDVDAPYRCPAARRAQIQHFDHSEDLDACPKLRNRAAGPISALCVPVSIMGRTVGVIHATDQPHAAVAEEVMADLGTLANLAGARIGLLRVMAETQLQAATDSLTGMLNRRAFEQRLTVLRAGAGGVAIVMADLDHFKALNDTYGHETGDRALRLFAQVVMDSVRVNDLTCRHGGEEFVIALPGCAMVTAHRVLDGLRERLSAAIAVAGLPVFTASFGVVEASEHEDLPTALGRADVALYQAKQEGRDRIVAHDLNSRVITPPTGSTVTPVLMSTDRHRPDAAGVQTG